MRVFPKVAPALLAGALSAYPAFAQSSPPTTTTWSGVTLSVGFECFNDTSALIVNNEKATQTGWQYSVDSPNDGVTAAGNGWILGTTFELHGMAFKETVDEVWVVLKGNSPIEGVFWGAALDQNIGWGDLFINPVKTDLGTASAGQQLFGIRFAGLNDSGASQVGVFGNVTAQSVSSINDGFPSWNVYTSVVNQLGGTVSIGDLDGSINYYPPEQTLNAIGSGQLRGPITFVTPAELAASGFDANRLLGDVTIGFRFDKFLVIDECGVVGGNGSTCLDCAGVPNGPARVDACGVCGGDASTCAPGQTPTPQPTAVGSPEPTTTPTTSPTPVVPGTPVATGTATPIVPGTNTPIVPGTATPVGTATPPPAGTATPVPTVPSNGTPGVPTTPSPAGTPGVTNICTAAEQSPRLQELIALLKQNYREVRRELVKGGIAPEDARQALLDARAAFVEALAALRSVEGAFVSCTLSAPCIKSSASSTSQRVINASSGITLGALKKILNAREKLARGQRCTRPHRVCLEDLEARLRKSAQREGRVRRVKRRITTVIRGVLGVAPRC